VPIDDKTAKGMQRIGELLPAIIKPHHKPLTPIQERLVSMPLPDEEAQSILYQHSVLCQTCMPYRDPGEAVRLWQRTNGIVRLELQAGRLLDPNTDDFVDVGLPFGPKPRLVMYHLNAEALRTQSPNIELDDSLTAFVKRTLGLDVGGRTIKTVKEQLNRLAAADIRFGASKDGRSITIKRTVIEGLELWTPKDARQRILWPTRVQFSMRYFESLMQHAVTSTGSALMQNAPTPTPSSSLAAFWVLGTGVAGQRSGAARPSASNAVAVSIHPVAPTRWCLVKAYRNPQAAWERGIG
jgi:hypothetical protein